jgi:topoisomerase IV subunit B
VTENYGAGDIRVLEGLEAVRLRPGMYIGSTGTRGLHHLVYEIVDNAVDEALAGHCSNIDVRIESDGSMYIRDDGRGIPTGMHSTGIPTPEVVFTKLHAGGKFGGSGYKVSGGLHGVGASVVNALSVWLEVEICRDGKCFRQRFERGVPKTSLEEQGNTRRRGTTVRFQPDTQIFSTTKYSVETLANRLRELAFLNSGLTIRLADHRVDVASSLELEGEAEETSSERFDEAYDYPGGIGDFVAYMNEGKQTFHEPIVFSGKSGDIEVEVAFQYTDAYSESVNSFVNCINTAEGGQHETGFRTAHTRVMNDYARRLGVWKMKGNLTGDDVREGLMAVLNLRMSHVEFEGQTKSKLGNPEARSAVEEVVSQHFAAFLEENPKVSKRLLENAARAAKARSAARKARAAVRTGKTSRGHTSLDGKLTRCSSKKVEENELFIVEGDSAGGSAKQARNRVHQAILPLRGKPLNTEKATLAKVLANKEILAIVQAVGAGIAGDFSLEDANYGRIIVLADADDDGAHIKCLLLTFFYRFMRPLLTAGRIYVAQPPLFKIERKSKRKIEMKYAWTPEELSKISAKWGKSSTIQRFKGLGEMNPDQLWDTTMNPDTRTLVRVTIEDAASAEKQVTVLMGSRAEPRKNWITANVHFGEDDPVDSEEADVVEGGAEIDVDNSADETMGATE